MTPVSETGWRHVPLGEVVTLHYGKALDKNDRDPDGSVPVYGANGIKDRSNKSLADGPSLIVGRKGSAGEITREDGPFWPLDVSYYTSHDPDRLDFDFLEYALATLNLPSMARGVKPGINRNDVYAVPMALPSLEEQKRIVAVLDQAFAALDRARVHAELNLADAEELLENSLNEVFREISASSPVVRLEDAVHPECRLSYGIVQPGDDVKSGLPIVRPVDLKQRVITLAGLKLISPDRADGYARTKLIGDELLLCVRGSTGELSIASPELAGGNVTRGIVPIRFEKDKVLREFAYFQLRSRYARDQIFAKTYGAALMQINIKDLRELNFVLPLISKQREAVARAENLYQRSHKLRGAYATKLTGLADLRQSLLQKAFSGQLT